MNNRNYDSLSQAVNSLTEEGFREDFRAGDTEIIGSVSGKNYRPEDLRIVDFFRFEGMTNPQDATVVFAIEAQDGNRGTLVMSYSAKHDQNTELIKRIPKETK
ncbi:phosphoribosylpyrophosphate synthetase [Muriicola marianensis]|uniref:Phosphoribosylpyrophosphate synthetase n=1 Tax=Muriicola marianensis TaxID=1324801 RepID=A0ABQ1R215_9FLAO|nr:phosphoribosylpyrophosphate synthetase [Muriicola marianensis]GGD53427.1 hypothetical protein GCM10011361_20150 [Muriicola marianensis]